MEDNYQEYSDYPVEFGSSNSIIKVIGVGGAGCNVVEEIYRSKIRNVDLMICNTDSQALENKQVNEKIILGKEGLGAGCEPAKGKAAALYSQEEIRNSLGGKIEMVFITAGLGGGTGTGASPVIAQIAKQMGKLVVAVVTIPFREEGEGFVARAMHGIAELRQYADCLLIIDNQKIYNEYENLSIKDGFKKVDEVLVTAVKSISEIVTVEGVINVDMNDVKMAMSNSGMAIMGIGEGSGEDKASKAVENAFKSPLLNDCDLKTSTGVLVWVTCSEDHFKMSELKQAIEHVKSYTGSPENFKRGIAYDNSLGDKVVVTIIATGFEALNLPDIPDEGTIIIPPKGDDENITISTYSPLSSRNSIDDKSEKVREDLLKGEDKPMRRNPGDRPVLITDDENEIIELENTPAYERKKRNRNASLSGGSAESGNQNIGNARISEFSVIGNSGNQIIFGNNKFLHQTQD